MQVRRSHHSVSYIIGIRIMVRGYFILRWPLGVYFTMGIGYSKCDTVANSILEIPMLIKRHLNNETVSLDTIIKNLRLHVTINKQSEFWIFNSQIAAFGFRVSQQLRKEVNFDLNPIINCWWILDKLRRTSDSHLFLRMNTLSPHWFKTSWLFRKEV